MAKLNITWPLFAAYNDDQTKAFEDMCRRLFKAKFLNAKILPHSNHNNPGIEVLPVLEPEREDGKPQQWISFQCKYVEQPTYAYSAFQKSAKETVKEYKGKLDLVYLFCNKTLTTTSKGYRDIVKIHDDAGIETIPISNDEILDMVNDYPDIAEYFFQPRIVADARGQQPRFGDGTTASMISDDRIVSDPEQPVSEELLEKLISEKLAACKEYALGLEFDALKSEVENLLSFGAKDGRLYYYQLLTALHEGNKTDESLSKCDEQGKTEAEWLINFYKNPVPLTMEELQQHSPIVQIFAIDKLFISGHWGDLITLHDEVGSNSDPSIQTQFDLRYGLSLLNLQENNRAKIVLHELYERTKEQRVHFYEVCASIRVENGIYQDGKAGHHDALAELIEELDTFKKLKYYSQQELFVAALKIESFYHLGIGDKGYIERAITEFNEYSEDIRLNAIIQYYYALCLELNGDRGKAIEVCEKLDWKANLDIAEHFMICLVLAEQPRKAIEVYESLEQKTAKTEAAYLFALDRSGNESYLDELQEAVAKYDDNIVDFLQIAYFADFDGTARDIILPAIRRLMSVKLPNDLLFLSEDGNSYDCIAAWGNRAN